MGPYLVRRALQALAVLALMSIAVYGLIGLMPGDPIDLMVSADPALTPADAERLRRIYGLHLPLHERYLNWLSAALGGDLGYSRIFARPVLEVIGPALLNTLLLLGLSLGLALLLAVPLGVLAAARRHRWIDHAINLLCFAGISVPSFWLALLLIMLFAVALGWLPAGGPGGPAHLVLPVATLTITAVGGYTRYVRAAVMEALRQDYVRTAEAKGAAESRVLLRHALPNAMIPVITVVALDVGGLFSGALIVETMFGWPGMGKLIYDAVMGNDYNLALAGLLFATLTTLGANLAADLGYVALDPRVTLAGARNG